MKDIHRKIMTPVLLLLFIMGTISQLTAQKAEIEKRLAELGISSDLAFNNLSENNINYSCNAIMTETTTEKTTVEKASFNPLKDDGSRWTLISVNGDTPSKKDIKKFNKAHNDSGNRIQAKPDENSMKIITDNEHILVIGLQYKESDLPKKYKFLAQCNSEIYVDKEAKRLYKIRFFNTEPLKIKVFNVVKLDMTMEFMQSSDGETTLLKDETTIMDVKLFGKMVEIIEKSDFYDYNKVK